MSERDVTLDQVLEALSAIHSTVQDILIIEGARAGISKAEVRKIAGVADARMTRIWKHLKIKNDKEV